MLGTALGQREPVLRVTAFLGATLSADGDEEIDSFSLGGCIFGCNLHYPADWKLIWITSLGATISTSMKGEAVVLNDATAALSPTTMPELGRVPLALQGAPTGDTAMTQCTLAEDNKVSVHSIAEYLEMPNEVATEIGGARGEIKRSRMREAMQRE